MTDWSTFLSAMTLALVLVSGMVVFAPFFSSSALPVRTKAALVLTIAFLLAPGAWAPSSHPRMRTFARLLGAFGTVEPFDYPYMLEGRGRPDPLPKLIAAHREALSALRARRHARGVRVSGRPRPSSDRFSIVGSCTIGPGSSPALSPTIFNTETFAVRSSRVPACPVGRPVPIKRNGVRGHRIGSSIPA